MASSGAPTVCDYYCEVGVRARLVPTATSPPHLFAATFEPSVLRRVPETDVDGVPFVPEVAMFCFAHGCRLATPEEAAANAIPVVTSFVLTAADKSRMYGACIVWYEPLSADVVNAYLDEGDAENNNRGSRDASLREAHAPEAICLLSRVAVFDALMEACRQLFRMRLQTPNAPIPSSSLNALLSTAIPGYGQRTTLPLGNVNVPVATPRANELPHTMAGRDFLQLFESLDVNNLIMLWALLLSEQKVALQGRIPHILTMAAETLSALLFPFSWQHVYIPILPERLLDILQAPVPFLIGIDETVLAVAEKQRLIPDDVVQVDLDRNEIMCEPSLAGKMRLPQKQYHKLYKAIAPYCRPVSTGDDGATDEPGDEPQLISFDDPQQQGPPSSNSSRRRSNAASAFPMAPPPDVEAHEEGARVTLAEMSDEAVEEAVSTIKAAFLRFFVSMMLKYQVLQPAARNQPTNHTAFTHQRAHKQARQRTHIPPPTSPSFSDTTGADDRPPLRDQAPRRLRLFRLQEVVGTLPVQLHRMARDVLLVTIVHSVLGSAARAAGHAVTGRVLLQRIDRREAHALGKDEVLLKTSYSIAHNRCDASKWLQRSACAACGADSVQRIDDRGASG